MGTSIYVQSLVSPYILPRSLPSSVMGRLVEPRCSTDFVHSMLIPPGYGIDYHCLSIAQTPFLLSRKVSELTFLIGFETGGYLTALPWQLTNCATIFALLCGCRYCLSD